MAKAKDNLRDVAQILFLNRMPQKDIAAKIGVSEVTVSRWSRAGNWEALRTNLLTSKRKRLSELYAELEEFNRMIMDKKNYKVADSKEADARRKLITDIRELETRYSIGQVATVAMDFCDFVKTIDMQLAGRVMELFTAFIDTKMEEAKWQE